LITHSCPCCGTVLLQGLRAWHWQCSACCYEASALGSEINQAETRDRLDERVRGVALRDLRQTNFRQLLRLIESCLPTCAGHRSKPRLLDVGAGHGWFVQAASTRFEVTGIEPDEAARAIAAADGVTLRAGFFPGCLDAAERFDVISFNDSLEHMPDVGEALLAAHRHLLPDGVVVLNLPDARGFFYRLSRVLALLGWSGPFDRMWQVGLPSPHLHYFRRANLNILAQRAGLAPVAQGRLESLRLRGLYARIAYARPGATLSTALLWLAMLPLLLAMRLAPSDIMVLAYRRV